MTGGANAATGVFGAGAKTTAALLGGDEAGTPEAELTRPAVGRRVSATGFRVARAVLLAGLAFRPDAADGPLLPRAGPALCAV
jgi:hypothetical protein